MNNLPLTEERQNLFKSILYVLKSLRKKADEYINTFDQKDFFVFSNEDTQKKHYQSKYCSFTVSIADDLLSLDRLMGNLSSLLLKSPNRLYGIKLKQSSKLLYLYLIVISTSILSNSLHPIRA